MLGIVAQWNTGVVEIEPVIQQQLVVIIKERKIIVHNGNMKEMNQTANK